MTATLCIGQHTESVCNFLGFQKGKYVFLRHSNARPEVQFLFREFNASRASDYFLQLDWILQKPGKTLIFCTSIRYGFKIAVHFWHLDPRNAILHQNIRLFNSLNSPDYNRETMELLEINVNSKITIATDKLSIGVDVSNFQTVVIIDPKDLDDLCQKGGRVGRDKTKVKYPQVMVYVPAQVMRDAKAYIDMLKEDGPALEKGDKATGRKKRKKKDNKTESQASAGCGGLYKALMARCPVAEINRQYGNPTSDSPCSPACQTCVINPPSTPPAMCNCSGCIPETMDVCNMPKQSRKPQVPVRIRVTQDMHKVGTARLQEYRKEIWENAEEISTGMIPIESYLPDTMIDRMFDVFPTLLSKTAIASLISDDGKVNDLEKATTLLLPFMHQNPALDLRPGNLLEVLWEIHLQFDKICKEKKEAARLKREAKKLAASGMSSNNMQIDSSDQDSEEDCD